MGRTKGAVNVEKIQEIYCLTAEERLEIVAKLLVEMISGELCTKD